MGSVSQLRFDSIVYEIRQMRILHGVYVEVNPGTICGIFGRNGSGKSTLLKIGTGDYLPTSGTVFIDQQVFLTPRKRQRYQKIAYLSQDTFLPSDLRLQTLLKAFPPQALDLVQDTILGERLDQSVGTLSGGECRLLEIVLLTTLDRPYLLLDEPFSGLEPLVIEQISRLLMQQRQQGKGILLTDHYYQHVIPLLDTAYLLQQGRCEPLDITSNLERTLQARQYLGDA
jgi:lipopolysaccharide export system ATP-binding protein